MKNHILRSIYFILFPMLVVLAIVLHQNKVLGYQIIEDQEKELYEFSLEQSKTAFDHVHRIKSFGAWCGVFDTNSNFIGILLHSNYYSPKVKGYNGKVPVIVAVDTDTIIRKVILLPNRETGDFVEILRKKKFFDSWNGIKMNDLPNHKVDAFSGATQTAVAIIENVNNTIQESAYIFDVKIEDLCNSISDETIVRNVSIFTVLTLALFSFFFPVKLRKYRIILLILNIGILGFWSTQILTMATLYNGLLNGWQMYVQIILLVLLILAILIPLFTGTNFYCQYVCPFGCMQELCSKVPVKKVKISQKWYTSLRKFRRLYLVIIVGSFIVGWDIDLVNMEPFLAFRSNIASAIVLTLAVVILITSLFINRPWCKYACPTGTLLSLFERKKY